MRWTDGMSSAQILSESSNECAWAEALSQVPDRRAVQDLRCS